MNTKSPRYDVTASVWNTFHFRELIQGLSDSGNKVLSIGTSRNMAGAAAHRNVLPSTALLMLSRRLQSSTMVYESQRLYDLLCPTLLGDTSSLWALSGSSARICTKAKKRGLPVILDTGGVHKRYGLRKMKQEHERMGQPYLEKQVAAQMRCTLKEYALADKIVCGSLFVKSSFVEEGVDESKLVVNPYGVNVNLWQQGRNSVKHSSTKTIFIYTAQISLRKGFHYLMDAWRKLALPNAELWICGTGDSRFISSLGTIPDSVIFHGFQSHEQIINLYKDAHIFVLPSLLEGFARSGAEAMVAGVPGIVTWQTGLTDVIDHSRNGWVIPAADSDALADQLAWCASHRDAVAEAAQEAIKVEAYLSFEAYGKRCSKVLGALLNRLFVKSGGNLSSD